MTTRDFTEWPQMTAEDKVSFFDQLMQAINEKNGIFGFFEDMGFMNVKKIRLFESMWVSMPLNEKRACFRNGDKIMYASANNICQ